MTGSERLVWSPPAYGVVVVGDAIVQLWEREAPASAFRALLGHLEERKRASPVRPLWMIAVSSDEASMPDAEARKISARFPEFFTEFALVIEGTGFRASAARGVMASMTMMSSKRARPHVVATVQEACATLAQASGGALDPSALVRSIGEARDALRR
jgi:hypothetical protein